MSHISRNDFELLSVVGSLLKYNNFTSPPPLLWSTIPDVLYHVRSHIFFAIYNGWILALGIILFAQVGTLRSRRRALYMICTPLFALLLLAGQYYYAWLTLWGVFHTAAHHFWPFINLKGLNVKASAFPDIVVHLTMHATVHAAAVKLGISAPTYYASIFILLGCIWNCYLASYSRVDEPWFVFTSVFQAFSSGSWVGYLISVGAAYQGGLVFEATLWAFWIGAAINWVVFKSSSKMLRKLFAISYLDTLFIIPVWQFMINTYNA